MRALVIPQAPRSRRLVPAFNNHIIRVDDRKLPRLSKPRPVDNAVFYHSGDRGDIIYALPTMRALGIGELVLGPDLNIKVNTSTRLRMDREIWDGFRLLFGTQPYIKQSTFSEDYPEQVTHNLNRFREFLVANQSGDYTKRPGYKGTISLYQAHLNTFGCGYEDQNLPWLQVDSPWSFRLFPIVINRSFRYWNENFPWGKLVDKYGDKIAFLGFHDEWTDFVQKFGPVHQHSGPHLMEVARIIAGAAIFIGNQSCPYAIAEALKGETIQETNVKDPNCVFNRKNGLFDTTDWGTINRKIEAALRLKEERELKTKTGIAKISFCTTCKNRLENLKQTLPINLQRAESYFSAEFVLVDYSSTDGLEAWVKKTFKTQMESGRLVVVASRGQPWYHSSHAKNVAHRVATGDLLVNLDADNLIGEKFPEYLNNEFQRGSDVIFSPIGDGTHGRIAVRKEKFYALGGYDEEFMGYGWDDNDLKERASRIGCRMVIMPGQYCNVLPEPMVGKGKNYVDSDIPRTNEQNRQRSIENALAGKFVANNGRRWGEAFVKRNYNHLVEL